jgi:hypothetical protein
MLSADSMSLRLATVHENGLVTISLLFSIAAPAIFMAAKNLLSSPEKAESFASPRMTFRRFSRNK